LEGFAKWFQKITERYDPSTFLKEFSPMESQELLLVPLFFAV
jgi:hypothetical protein